MKPLTNDEISAAQQQLLLEERAGLARTRELIRIHRDVLTSPAARISELEATAILSVRVIEDLENPKVVKTP
jgi:hypothetical protein